MNQTLKNAIREVEALPEAEQEELSRVLMDLALRKKIDALLAEAESEGGEIPAEEVFQDLRQRYGA